MSFLLSQFERVEAPAKEAPVKDAKDDTKDLVRKDEKEKKPPTRKGSRSSQSSRASRAVLSSTGGKREREREERQSRSSKKRSGIEKRSNRDRPATDSKRTTRSAAAAAKAAKAAKKSSTGKPKKPTTAKPAKVAKVAKVAKATTTDAVVSTSKAIVPVVAAPPNPDLTREDPEWASESERAARATSVLKTVKKASRANTKRQRGTNKKGGAQPKEDKPLSAMTLKEIIRQSVEAERKENRKKNRKNRNKSSGDAKDGKSGEGADGRGSARGGGGAGTSSSPLFKDAGTNGGKESIAPQVQVVDGQIVVNQQSLSVKAQIEPLMKPERRVEESGNKLSAFSYSGYLAPEKWTKEDTHTFYTVLEQFGTDFGTIQKFFPKRERKQIKSKFRREEKSNPEKIELALKTHRGMSAEVCVEKMKDLVKLLERPEVD